MATFTDAEKILQENFGLNSFRPHQIKIIQAILTGQDVLAILATGGGKSICFQVPALLYSGLTLVITPLISLMVNQVLALKNHHIAAAAWHSQLSHLAETEILNQLKSNQLKLLYLSPEKLISPVCQSWLKTQKINLLVIDEAHCLALWGNDFRPSYLKISSWIKSQPHRPQVLALTATATQTVKVKIISQLNLIKPIIFQESSVRSNISLNIIHRQTPVTKLISLFSLCRHQASDSILIYCATKIEVETLTKLFQTYQPDERIILKYHGGLTSSERQASLASFLAQPSCIMIATNAFGMGIDKPNIRLIIHSQIPSNLENYAQEIGRASRDGQPATAVLIVSDFDWEIQLKLSQSQPEHWLKMAWLKYFCLTKTCKAQVLAAFFNESIAICGHCGICQPKNFQPPPDVWQKYRQLIALKIPYRKNLKLLAFSRKLTLAKLAKLPGIGPNWFKRWGNQTLKILAT